MGDSTNSTDWSDMHEANTIQLSELQVYSYTVLGLTSLIAGLVLLVAYARVRVLREPPGMLIFWQCVGQTIVDFHWAHAGVYYLSASHMNDSLSCRLIGLLSLYFYFLTWNYTLSLSYEIYSKVRNPLRHSYRRKSWLYHCFSHFSCICLVVAIGTTNAAGISVSDTCFIRDGSWAESVMMLLVLFYFPLSLGFLVAAFRHMRHSPAMRSSLLGRYMWFVLMCCILYAPSAIDHIFQQSFLDIDSPGLRQASVVMGSSAGLILDLMRLYDPSVVARAKAWVCRRRKDDRRPSSFEASSPIIPLFDDQDRERSQRRSSFYDTLFFKEIIQESVISTLLSLNLIYDKLTPSRGAEIAEFPVSSEWPSLYFTQENSWSLSSSDLWSIPGIELLYSRVPSFNAEITEYAPLVTAHLKAIDGVTNSDLAKSFSPLLNVMSLEDNLGNRGGRSDSFLYFSYDRRFILKTLSKSESSLLKSTLLPLFHRHKSTRSSLLSSIYGIFSIRCNNTACFDIIILRNIVQNESQVTTKFDIKGSLTDRRVLADRQQPEPLQVCKDVDFINIQKELYLEKLTRDQLFATVKSDVGLLKELNIMDYSLLVAIAGREAEVAASPHVFQGVGKDRACTYYIGLIDFLQVFNRKKRLESFSKQLRGSRAAHISSINSEDYAERFVAFVGKILRVEAD